MYEDNGPREKKYDPEYHNIKVPTRAQMAEAEFRTQQSRQGVGDSFRSNIEFSRQEALSEIGASRISQQIAELQDQLQKTHALFTELKIRIEPVLFPERDADKAMSDDDVTRVPGSEISEALCDLRGAVGKLQRRIGETLERVQL